METFIDFIQAVYAMPVDIWIGYEYMPANWVDRVLAVLMGLVIYGLTIGAIWLMVDSLVRYVSWRKHRRQCQHCRQWTLATTSGAYQGCSPGSACCGTCSLQHQSDAEPRYHCPVDGQQMSKKVDEGIVTDYCGRHVLLSYDELAALRKLSYDSGYSAGRSSGQATGIAIGSAL